MGASDDPKVVVAALLVAAASMLWVLLLQALIILITDYGRKPVREPNSDMARIQVVLVSSSCRACGDHL